MIIKTHILTAEQNSIVIPIHPENPFFAVKKANVIYPNPQKKMGNIADIKITTIKSESSTESYDVRLSNAIGAPKGDLEQRFQNFNDPNIQKIAIELKNADPEDELSVELEIQTGRDLLDLKKPWQEFNNHISTPANTKIFFSAPFGQGKTTFLNEFFKQENDTYEVFRIFPVNYSVASNQDIFRYIKADLLYQLVVDKVCEFEKLDASYLKTIPAFIKKNPDKILAPFLMLIPGVGKNIFSFYEKIKTVADSFVDLHDSESKDDEKAVDSFLKKLLEEEGSIYEDNLLTQIIRQQIKSINTKKKSVLVIDDLDRLDPEHTFRILNIISAHYDIYENSDSTDYNKFGFDKIIVVCDIENVKNIFEHRYGARANFSGYINKFYSTSHFPYDNKKVMYQLLNGLVDTQPRNGGPEIFRRPLKRVLMNLIACEELSLRDLMNLQKISFKDVILYHDSIHISDRSNYFRGIYTHVVGYLRKIFTHEMLISKIQRCKQVKAWVAEDDSNECSWSLLASLALVFDSDPNLGYHYIYKKESYSLRLERDHSSNSMRVKGGQKTARNIDFDEKQFIKDDFFNLLIESVNLYEELIASWETNLN